MIPVAKPERQKLETCIDNVIEDHLSANGDGTWHNDALVRYVAGDDHAFDELFSKAVIEIKLTSSPGHPLNMEHGTNQQLVDRALPDLKARVATRLNYLVNNDITELSYDDHVRLADIAYDPVSPIIKNEPHSPEKLAIGKIRVIFPSSIVDQLVERMIMGPFYERFKEAYQPEAVVAGSMLGIGFTDAYNRRTLSIATALAAVVPKVVSTDVRSYDAIIPGVAQKLTFSKAAQRLQVEASAAIATKVRRLVGCIGYIHARLPVLLHAGRSGYALYQKQEEGKQPSGILATSPGNTISRLALSQYVTGLRGCALAASDDALEGIPADVTGEELIRRYAEIGIEIKGTDLVSVSSDMLDFEFCSHLYYPARPGCASLTSWKRCCVRFAASKDLTSLYERAASLIHEIRHNPPEQRSRIMSFMQSHFTEVGCTWIW